MVEHLYAKRKDAGSNPVFALIKREVCPGVLRKMVNAILFAEYGPRKLARRMWLFGEKT